MNPEPTLPPTKTSLSPMMAVGTFVVDYHKVIDHYPHERGYAHIKRELVSNGGAPLNLLINLAKLGVEFPLVAAGKVGRDLDGQLILETCIKHGINTSQLIAVEGASTGYTDVFTVESTGKHTCFHCCGIGDTFSRKDVKMRTVMPKILFLGSLGALGKMDHYNPDYGRKGATQLVRDARKRGITSVVELAPIKFGTGINDYKETLAQADYLILSDRLAEELMGIELYTDGQFDPELAQQAASKLMKCGLRKAAIIHAGSGAVYLDAKGRFFAEPGILLPSSERISSAGVDHAFSAGFIEGLYYDKPVEICLKQGLAVATACRRHLTPSDGIPPLGICMEPTGKAPLT